MIIAKYTFDKTIDENCLPSFNSNFAYTISDSTKGNVVTRTIESNNLPTQISFNAKVSLISVEYLDISQLKTMQDMFRGCSQLTQLDLSDWDTSQVTNTNSMFNGCSSLTQLDLSKWDTSQVTIMYSMFNNCPSLTQLDLSKWDISKVTNTSYMFNGCSALTQLDVSKWDTSQVTAMYAMFNSCSSLTQLDLSSWNTKKLTDISNMFFNCSSLTHLDLSNFDTSQVTSMSSMFNNCSSLTHLDLSNFDTSKVTSMSNMFNNCSLLVSIGMLYCSQESVNNIVTGLSTLNSIIYVKDTKSIDYTPINNITFKDYKEEITEFVLPTQLGINDRLYWDKDKSKYVIEKDEQIIETDITYHLSVKTFNPTMSISCFGDVQASNIKATVPFRDLDGDYNEKDELEYIKQSFEMRFPDEEDVPEGWGFMGLDDALIIDYFDSTNYNNRITTVFKKPSSDTIKVVTQSGSSYMLLCYGAFDERETSEDLESGVTYNFNSIKLSGSNQTISPLNTHISIVIHEGVTNDDDYFELNDVKYKFGDLLSSSNVYKEPYSLGAGLKALIDWVDGCTDEEFVRDFDQHFHRDYTLRYFLLVITLG